MKFVSLVLLTVGSIMWPFGSATLAAADASSEIVALEKKLVAARDEINALKTALAISKSQTQAAETKAQALAQPDSQLGSLRSQLRVLERDLETTTSALKRVATAKDTAEAALNTANQQLATAAKELTTLRARAATPVQPPPPVISEQKLTELQSELSEARSRLAGAEKAAMTREAELTKLRTTPAQAAQAESRPAVPSVESEATRRATVDAQQKLAAINKELAETRDQITAARELESRLRQLAAEKAEFLARSPEAGISKDVYARATAAQAEAEQRLAASREVNALLGKERDEFRARAAKVAEFEARIRQLEAEKASAPKAVADTSVNQDELARLTAARAEAETKLSTVLRSFTLLTKERDELRAKVAELSAKLSSGSEKN